MNESKSRQTDVCKQLCNFKRRKGVTFGLRFAPLRTNARDYVKLVKAAAYRRAPKAGALPGCATPRMKSDCWSRHCHVLNGGRRWPRRHCRPPWDARPTTIPQPRAGHPLHASTPSAARVPRTLGKLFERTPEVPTHRSVHRQQLSKPPQRSVGHPKLDVRVLGTPRLGALQVDQALHCLPGVGGIPRVDCRSSHRGLIVVGVSGSQV